MTLLAKAKCAFGDCVQCQCGCALAEAGKVLAQKVKGTKSRRHRRFRSLTDEASGQKTLTWPLKRSKLPLRYPFPASHSEPDLTDLTNAEPGASCGRGQVTVKRV